VKSLKIKTFIIVVCSLLLISSPVVLGQEREYQIKAEFLERFTRFIKWPSDSTVSNPSSPFCLCVIGKNPYGTYLSELSSLVKIQKKQITLTEISSLDQIRPCNLLFISDSEKATLSSILAYTVDKPILTVSDSPGFAQRGVLINFYEDEGFVRFEINIRAVEKSRLRFSSRLLKLGRLVNQENAITEQKNAVF
jgi:hypothetical protein